MTRGGSRINAGRPAKPQKEKLAHLVRLTDTEKDFINFSRVKKIDLAKIKKTLAALALLCMLTMPAGALTLEASVEYTVDSARIIAFENTDLKIAKSEYLEERYDPYFYVNTMLCIRSGATHDDFQKPRKIVPFYEKDGKLSFYGVQYDDRPAKKYYYSPAGTLLKYEVSNFNGNYPYKTMAYDIKGNLININLVVSPTESFLFDSKKNLLGHWLNNQFYDEAGNLDITRRL